MPRRSRLSFLFPLLRFLPLFFLKCWLSLWNYILRHFLQTHSLLLSECHCILEFPLSFLVDLVLLPGLKIHMVGSLHDPFYWRHFPQSLLFNSCVFISGISDWLSSALLFHFWIPLSKLTSPSLFHWRVRVLYRSIISALIYFNTFITEFCLGFHLTFTCCHYCGITDFLRSYNTLIFHLSCVIMMRFTYSTCRCSSQSVHD